jgi:hypothetical protein
VDLKSHKVQFDLNQYESVILCLDEALERVALVSQIFGALQAAWI